MALLVIRVDVIAIALIATYLIFEHARTRWWRTPGGRQLMLTFAVAFTEHIIFALVVSRVRLSPWVFVILFNVSLVAWIGWLVLMVQVRRGRTTSRDESEINRDQLSGT